MNLEPLRVIGVDHANVHHEPMFDEYVPLRVRSYSQPLGAAVVRLGDYSSTLLELVVECQSQHLRGLTLVSLAEVSPWPELRVQRAQPGAPILGTSFTDRAVLDLALEFKVAVGDEGILIFWQGLDDCESCDAGRVRYLVRAGILAAVWCTEVTQNERDVFRLAAGS
jgi:hypothetical protein